MNKKFDDEDRGTQIHPSQALPHRTLEEHNRIAGITGPAAPTEKPREPVEGIFVQDLLRIARKWARGKDEQRGSTDFVFTKARFVEMMDEVAAATTAASTVPADMEPSAVKWSHDLQPRMIAANDQGLGEDDLLNLLGEAACCLAALTGMPGAAAPSAALSDEVLSLHRQLGAEKLRADLAEERATAKSRECIELREERAAALSEKAEPQWLPIESAPHDGRAVLLTRADAGGAWIGKYDPVYQSGYRPDNPWFSLMLNRDYMPKPLGSSEPTHWMPLPTPPATTKDQAASKGGNDA